MSLINDVLTQLETKLRGTVVTTAPAGTAGVEIGWRASHQLEPGELPHVFLFNESETQELLIFRQMRSTVTVTGLIVRRDSTHAQMLADYGAIATFIEADPTLNGKVEQSHVQLDGIENEQGKGLYFCAFTFIGLVIL